MPRDGYTARDVAATRCQDAIALDDESEPEPDVVVVPSAHTDYRDRHPERTAVVIEVPDSSLAFDRREKGSLYARGGVQDYWIVNLVDRVLEVYRDPVPDSTAVYGAHYRSVVRFTPPEIVALLALPTVRIAVADLLP